MERTDEFGMEIKPILPEEPEELKDRDDGDSAPALPVDIGQPQIETQESSDNVNPRTKKKSIIFNVLLVIIFVSILISVYLLFKKRLELKEIE